MTAEPADRLLELLVEACERRQDPAARAVSVAAARAPGYLDERDPTIRAQVNASLTAWEAQGWVELRWVRGEEGNLLDRIRLRVEALPHIYAYLRRTPAADLEAALGTLLARWRPQLSPQADRAIAGVEVQLAAGRSPAPFQFADPRRNEDLLRALQALDSLEEELPARDFSARVLGDSKRLAALQGGLLALLRRAHPELAGLPRDEAWAAAGLLPNPGHLYLHGALVFRLGAATVDLRAFSPDLGLPVHAVSRLEVVSLPARYLLTVENRTAFYDQVAAFPGDGLVLYLGGFPNRARRLLLERLSAAAPALPLYHWGDLDYGGLAILACLRRTLARPIHAHQMDPAALDHGQASGRPLTRADRCNLERLLEDEMLEDCRAVIQALLRRGIKLEQEALPPREPGA